MDERLSFVKHDSKFHPSHLGVSRLRLVMPVPTVVKPVRQCSIPVVHRELSSLDISKGAGPDEIHPQMVRCLAYFLAEPLS